MPPASFPIWPSLLALAFISSVSPVCYHLSLSVLPCPACAHANSCVWSRDSLMDFCHIKPNPALTDLSVGPLLSSLSHCTPSSSSPLIFVLICSLNPFIAPHFFAGQRLLYELVILFLIFSSQVQPINPTYLMPNATCLLITYALMHSLHFSNAVYCRRSLARCTYTQEDCGPGHCPEKECS